MGNLDFEVFTKAPGLGLETTTVRLTAGTRELAVFHQIADGLVKLAEFAAPEGVQILIETHGDFSASPPSVEVMRLANHPFVGLVWDRYHPWRFHDERLTESWKQLRPWTRHTHWKDSVVLPTQELTPEKLAASQAALRLMARSDHDDVTLRDLDRNAMDGTD